MNGRLAETIGPLLSTDPASAGSLLHPYELYRRWRKPLVCGSRPKETNALAEKARRLFAKDAEIAITATTPC